MDKNRRWKFLSRPSTPGLILAAAVFVAALTPSLIPRPWPIQGALAGIGAAIGYMIGAALTGIWAYLGLAMPEGRAARGVFRTGAAVAAAIALYGLFRATGWQNAVHAAVSLPPVESAFPVSIAAVAAVFFLLLAVIGRAFRLVAGSVARWLERFMPPRLSLAIALVVAAAFFWTVGNGLLMANVLAFLDRTYARIDQMVTPDQPRPDDPLKSGSPASLTRWADLGNMGRDYVVAGPDAAEIAAVTGGPAKEPLRVYVGLNSAETPQERARLALDELIRIGAFERGWLQIATPTGTGWIDPAAQMPVEFLTRGDIATVAVQYSYLPSWLTLIVDRSGYGAETAREVFRAVYGYWRTLPKDRRPRLYLSGLSLGSVNGQAALDLYDVIADPFQGALWVGPPFANQTWRELTEGRNKGTPIWLPTFRDSSVVRFTAQENHLAVPGAVWGPMRIVYLQYASDPIVFFREDSWRHEPDYLKEPRGPDVSPKMQWIPVVTFLQTMVDMVIATTVPLGRGHVYAAEDYAEAWAEVLAVPGQDDAFLARLKAHLAAKGI
ncbi:MAG: alpha/beta-hydrolase family protein [Rhodobacteraceae bacterium]|nr:alpha/beta-hydrolase family protein [Paracoccaceae bacterium]